MYSYFSFQSYSLLFSPPKDNDKIRKMEHKTGKDKHRVQAKSNKK